MFYGEKLKDIRELNGLSRKELANKVNVTEQAIWQFEKNLTIPRFELVNDIKNIFSVKSQFFFSEPFLKQQVQAEDFAYRSNTRDSRRTISMETKYIDFSDCFVQFFEQKLDKPVNKIDELKSKISKLYIHNFIVDADFIEDAANYSRRVLGINNNSELMYKMEIAGIYILEKNVGFDVDAYSVWTKSNRSFIVLGTTKRSAVRRNFDLAHELGHLVMHSFVDMDSLDNEDYKRIEKEANLFASAFLLPREDFIKDFSILDRPSNPKSYIAMKAKYLVSISALEMRAYNMDELTYSEHRYFYASLNRYKFKRDEPLDDELTIVRPGKIRALLDIDFEHKLFNLVDVLNTFKVDQGFIEKLFGFNDGFLFKYLTMDDGDEGYLNKIYRL